MTVAIAAQLLGALTGFGLRGDTDWFDAAWLGGAFATFPGFVAGFFYQAATDAVGLRDNKVMVAFCGGISLLLTLAAWMLLARQCSRALPAHPGPRRQPHRVHRCNASS
jgi:hypothetical protein